MSNTRSTQQHSLFWYTAMGVGYVFMIAMRLMISLAKWLVSLVGAATKIHRSIAMERVKPDDRADVTSQAVTLAVPVAGSGRVTFKGHDFSDYEVAEIRCIQFPKVGFMSIWAYKRRGVVKRCITFTNPKVAKATGLAKLPLPDMIWPKGSSITAVEDACIRDAEEMINAKCGQAGKKATLVGTALTVPATRENVNQHQAAAVGKTAGEPTAQGGRSAPYVHLPPAQEVHKGVLQDMGVFSRQQGDRTFDQYAIDLMSPEVGPSRVWGEDLQRALEASGARVGDTVEVKRTGRSARQHGTKKGHMNHYVVRVL